MKRTIILGVLAIVVMTWAVPATAQNTVSVRLTNVSKQIISPPLLVTHTWKARAFIPGNPASDELAMLAEDGDPMPLAALLSESDEVLDVVVSEGPLMPGDTLVFDLEKRGRFNRISAVGMLVTTNDAFFGVDNVFIEPGGQPQHVSAVAWDAGTESNNELCDFIPGPPCGNPMVRDTAGAEGFIHVHPGLHGGGDLSTAEWDWQNPVVNIKIFK
jgi:hypothetical protein